MKSRSWMMAAAAVCGLAVTNLHAQLPQPRLDAVWPLGGKAGQVTEVTLSGDDLDGTAKLLFSHPRITAEPRVTPPNRFFPSPRPVPNRFNVTVAADVPPGVYEVRSVGVFGISNARRFVVAGRPQASEQEPNNDIDHATQLPLNTWLNGACDDEAYDYYRFTAEAGQRLLCHGVAERLHSHARLAITLYDTSGRELARSARTSHLDSLIDFDVPSDGDYMLRVHDTTYHGGDARYGYRLIVTDGPWIDYVVPPMVQAGAETAVTVYGRNLPQAGEAEGVEINGHRLIKTTATIVPPADVSSLELPIDVLLRPTGGAMDHHIYRMATGQGVSPPLYIGLTESPVTPEREPNDAPGESQQFYPPAELVGRFERKGDLDGYRFEAKKGDRLAIELFSQRLGVSVDPVLVVQRVISKPDGSFETQDLQVVDDSVAFVADKNHPVYRYPTDHADPAWLLDVPEDGVYRILVRDQFSSGQGDPRFSYRLSVGPPRPDFRLVAFPFQSIHVAPKKDVDLAPQAAVLRPGQTQVVVLAVFRSPGVNNDIHVHVEGLPEAVTSEPIVIPSWQSYATLAFKADVNAVPWAGAVRIVGMMVGPDGKSVVRHARAAEVFDDAAGGRRVISHLVSAFSLAVTNDFTFPVGVEIVQPAVVEVVRGGSVQVPVKLHKQGEFKGGLTLKPMGIGGDMSVPDVGLNAKTPEGVLTLNVGAQAPAGTFNVLLHGFVSAPFQRNPAAVSGAEEDKLRITQIHAQSQQALEEATKMRQAAEQNAQTVTDNPELVAQARQTLESAKAAEAAAGQALQEAEAANKEAEEAVKKAAAAAAARDIPMPVSSNTITVRVIEK